MSHTDPHVSAIHGHRSSVIDTKHQKYSLSVQYRYLSRRTDTYILFTEISVTDLPQNILGIGQLLERRCRCDRNRLYIGGRYSGDGRSLRCILGIVNVAVIGFRGMEYSVQELREALMDLTADCRFP